MPCGSGSVGFVKSTHRPCMPRRMVSSCTPAAEAASAVDGNQSASLACLDGDAHAKKGHLSRADSQAHDQKRLPRFLESARRTVGRTHG